MSGPGLWAWRAYLDSSQSTSRPFLSRFLFWSILGSPLSVSVLLLLFRRLSLSSLSLLVTSPSLSLWTPLCLHPLHSLHLPFVCARRVLRTDCFLILIAPLWSVLVHSLCFFDISSFGYSTDLNSSLARCAGVIPKPPPPRFSHFCWSRLLDRSMGITFHPHCIRTELSPQTKTRNQISFHSLSPHRPPTRLTPNVPAGLIPISPVPPVLPHHIHTQPASGPPSRPSTSKEA